MKRGLVLGCGGTVGGAWQIGALAGVEKVLGWDPRTADVIVGTSAGATAAAMLGAGVGVDEMIAAHRGDEAPRASVRDFCTRPPAARPVLPRGLPSSPPLVRAGLRSRATLTALAGLAPAGRTNPQFLSALVDDLVPDGTWVPHPAMWIVATDLATGERVAFGAPGRSKPAIGQAVRASWAVPGWYPPVTIEGRSYIDGGAASTASADLVTPLALDEVVVIAPMASGDGARVAGVTGAVEALMRRPMSRRLDREIGALRDAGTNVVRVHPGAYELAVMGPNFMNPRRRLPALEVALAQQPGRLETSWR